MKRLLLMVPSLKMGGQERIAVETAKILKENFEVYICVFDGSDPFYDKGQFRTIDLKIPASQGIIQKAVHLFHRIQKVNRLKRSMKIDYTYSFGGTANLVNVCSKCSDCRMVSIHGYASTQGLWNKHVLIPLFVQRADLVFTVSEEIRNCLIREMEKKKTDKIKVLYNPYPIREIYEKCMETNGMDIKGKLIATMGRLIPIKGYPHLLRAFQLVSQDIHDAKLVFIGDGKERKNLERQACELGLKDKVVFLGNVENPFSYLRQCDLYCLTSYHEGFPNALAEAMICGLPVIAADCKSGPREILGYEAKEDIKEPVYLDCGTLIPAFQTMGGTEEENERILASEMIKMLLQPELKKQYASALKTRCEMFSEERYRMELLQYMGMK